MRDEGSGRGMDAGGHGRCYLKLIVSMDPHGGTESAKPLKTKYGTIVKHSIDSACWRHRHEKKTQFNFVGPVVVLHLEEQLRLVMFVVYGQEDDKAEVFAARA